MSKRHLILYTIALAVPLSAYVGYRFYDNRVAAGKSIRTAKVAQFETGEDIQAADRAFLRQAEAVRQLPRDIKTHLPSSKLPVWVYTPAQWDSSVVNPVKVIVLPMEAVAFHALRLPDGKAYKARPLKEQRLPALGVISGHEGIYIKNPPIPENPPEFRSDSPRWDVPSDSSDVPPNSYPLIATFVIDQDGTPLMRLEDWIKLVGGAGRAKALLDEAGLPDSIAVETLIHQSTVTAEPPNANRFSQE